MNPQRIEVLQRLPISEDKYIATITMSVVIERAVEKFPNGARCDVFIVRLPDSHVVKVGQRVTKQAMEFFSEELTVANCEEALTRALGGLQLLSADEYTSAVYTMTADGSVAAAPAGREFTDADRELAGPQSEDELDEDK